jgi:hypothetical protein
MIMLPKTRHRARRLRSGVLTLTLAAFVPLAVPVTASASTIPGYPPPGAFVSYPLGNEFLNQVNANSETNQKTVFKVKFGLGEGASPIVTAVNRAVAVTSRCANCTAIAIGFQVVTTTDQDLVDLRAINVAKATNNDCTATCNAVADAYQVVVATDTPQPMSFGQLLSPQQRNALYQLRSEFLALPNSGLSLPQIEAQCGVLAGQAMDILEDANSGGPSSGAPVDTTPTLPTFSRGVHGVGADTELTGSGQPVVNLYHDLQSKPSWSG